MSNAAHCSECGATLPTGILGNRCPRCLVQLALDTPADQVAPVQVPVPDESPLGRGHSFGDYEMLEVIARGGMGIVYKARQKSLNRIVAVKLMLSSGQLARPEVVQRFRTEAQAIAHLQHPNIVAIHEVGEHDGQPYFSMEYVEGRTLAEMVRDGPLAATRAAIYLKTISEAVQYAHTHGILHRDLKPSNVLIDSSDQPRITDFGLAKRLENSHLSTFNPQLTLSGQVLGSPNYLSPEQAAGRPAEVGPASDVYALGAMLYHLLTGRPPFQGDSLTALLRQVIETDPVGPRLLNPGIPRDLETICLKCLEKDRSRRYGTAQALADELGRFLRGEPIRARPASPPERVWRWCRRGPVRASLIGALVVVFGLGLAGVLWQWRRADAQRDAAVQARLRSERERYDTAISEAQLLIEQKRPDRAREILAREGQEGYRGWEWGWLQRQVNQDLMSFRSKDSVMAVAWSPDQRYLASAGYDQVITLWDLETGRAERVFKGHSGRIWSLVFSPDGKSLLSAGLDTTARVWDVASGRQLRVLTNGDGVWQALFSPDGQVIATAAINGGGRLWDARSGAVVSERLDHDQAVLTIAFSPDGRRLACAGGGWALDNDADTTVSVIDRSGDGDRVRRFKAHRQTIHHVRFSPDGSLLATASADGTAKLWNVHTGAEIRSFQRDSQFQSIFDVDFSPDGRWLALSGMGWNVGSARIFEVATGHTMRSLEGHGLGVMQIKFSPDGTRLATAGIDATTRLWPAANLPEFVSLEGHDQAVWAITFSRDGKRVASGGLDQTARVWDANTGDLLATLNVGLPVVSLAFSPDGDRLATMGTNHTAKVWNATNGQEMLTLSGHAGTVMAAAWSPDGSLILTGSKDGTARLWDAATGAVRSIVAAHSNWVLCVAFSPDGTRFATGGADNAACIWQAQDAKRLHVLPGHRHWVQQVAFSPDGQQVATGCRDRKVRLFDADAGRLLVSMEGHRSGISSLAFSPDGTRLATAAEGEGFIAVRFSERAAVIWDVRTGQRLLKLEADSSWVTAVAFSPRDGRRLATGLADNTVRIREAFPWKREDYAAEAGASLGETMEAVKHRYWQERLRAGSSAVPLDRQAVRPGRRVDTYYSGTTEVNVPAESGGKIRPAKVVPAREPNVDSNLLDLTDRYNAGLDETWQPIYALFEIDLNLASLPVGVHTLAGVPFDIRGLIRLSRPALGWAIFPVRVEIPAGRKFHRLHALHGAGASALQGAQIGTYRLHYRDGSSEDLRIIYGRDLRYWVASGGALAQPMEATVAWTGPADLTRPAEMEARLYRRTYENRFPEREVIGITFESTMTGGGPFLVALTVEP